MSAQSVLFTQELPDCDIYACALLMLPNTGKLVATRASLEHSIIASTIRGGQLILVPYPGQAECSLHFPIRIGALGQLVQAFEPGVG